MKELKVELSKWIPKGEVIIDCFSAEHFAEKNRAETPEKLTFSYKIKRTNAQQAIPDTIQFQMELSGFINRSWIANDHFNRFLLLRLFTDSDGRIKGTIGFQGNSNLVAPGSENKIFVGDIAHLYENSHGFASISISTINISGIPYRLFAHLISYQAGEDWLLCGLVPENEFQKEVRRVQPVVIVFLTLILIFLLLSMPILKLMIMSEIERLQIINVWSTGLCFIIGSGMVILTLLAANHYFGYEREYNRALRSLSKDVEQRFLTELADITQQLKQSDSQRPSWESTSEADSFLSLLRQMSAFDTSGFFVSYIQNDHQYIHYRANYPFFNETIWLNEEGEQKITLASHSLSEGKRPNLGNRQYFSDALNGKLFHLVKGNDTLEKFCIQSMFSWHNLSHEAGISILPVSNDSIKVLSMATKLRSVMNPLLEPGYELCIIDDEGKVLFHSQTGKNLQENFFDEIENDATILSAVRGRASVLRSINYGGAQYQAFVRPINNLPLYLVTLFDREYYKTPIVLTIGFAFVLLVLLYAVQGILVFLLFVTTYRPTKLRIKRFFMNWLRPRIVSPEAENTEGHNTQDTLSYAQRYAGSTTGMVLIAIVMAVITLFYYAKYLIVTFITLPIILLVFHFTLFHDDIRALAATRVSPTRDNTKNAILLRYGKRFQVLSHPFLLVSVGLLILINSAAAFFLRGEPLQRLTSLQLIFILILVFSVYSPTGKTISRIWLRFSKARLYILFLFVWLILSSVAPALYFYKVAYFHEQEAWNRYLLWETHRNIENYRHRVAAEARQLEIVNDYLSEDTRDSLLKEYVSFSDRYGNYLNTDYKKIFDTKNIIYRRPAIDSIEFLLRPRYHGPMERSRIGLTSPYDMLWQWKFNRTVRQIAFEKPNSGITYSSLIPPYSLFSGHTSQSILFILALLSAGILLYAVLLKAVKTIFGLTLIPAIKPLPITTNDLNAKISQAKDIKPRIFLIGLPFSGKSQLLDEFKKKLPKRKVREFSFRNEAALAEIDSDRPLPEKFLPGMEEDPKKIPSVVYILRHFVHGINDHAMNEKKRRILIALQRFPNFTIIISTTVQPTIILDIYEKMMERLGVEKEVNASQRANIDRKIDKLNNSFRIWKNLLADYQLIYHPLESKDSKDPIDQKLGFGTFLPTLRPQLVPKDKKGIAVPFTREEKEDFVLSVEEAAESYYHALWSSFSHEEKYMLFDLAKDRFVNLRNLKLVRILMKKGVIVMRDSLQIMNKSFNNFILAAVKEDEEMRMMNELRRRGTWHGVQLILMVTLISIVVFIGLSQHELLTSFNVMITTVGGIITLLLKLGGSFGSSKAKE